jgi:hypothetical protein
VDSGPIPVDSGPIPVDSGPIPVDSGPIPVDSGGFLQEWEGHCKVLIRQTNGLQTTISTMVKSTKVLMTMTGMISY